MTGYARFMKVCQESQALRARLLYVQQDIQLQLADTLREETGADPTDTLPTLVAGQLSWVHSTLTSWIGGQMAQERAPGPVSREALVLLDDIEELLGERVLKYAVRAG